MRTNRSRMFVKCIFFPNSYFMAYVVHQPKLGKGTYGSVYRVTFPNGKEYAVKHVEDADDDKEAKLMKGFNHPNIVQCYDYHLSEKHGLFMVLQLCTGGQLRGVKRDESNSIPLFLQITNAIKYLHSKNVWHRDLKPENIFLDEQGNIKVGDLGIAKVMQNTDATSALYYYGSTPYISPQILERDSYSAKADVWSLGCIFHEVLSGEIAFKSKELTKQIHYTELGHKFSFGIRELIKDMLLKKESDRPSSDDVFARLELIQGKKYVQPPSPKKTELAVDWPKLVTAILIAEGKNANIIR